MERNKYIDIVKAIGIISIVIGHSIGILPGTNIHIGNFVYSYHIMIFVFIAGFLINTDRLKTDDNYKYTYIGKHLIKMIFLCFLYNTFFILIHNTLIDAKMINGIHYDVATIFNNIFNGLMFNYSEKLSGTFWFIPMLLITEIITCLSYSYICNSVNKKVYYLLIVFSTAFMGLFMCSLNINLSFHVQVSLLAVPIMYLGVFVKSIWNKIEKNITSYGCFIIIPLIMAINGIFKSNIDLSANQIITPYMFYIITCMGIYFCLSLAKLIEKTKYTRTLFSKIGINSFHIMALHFFVFKIIDCIYSAINGISETEIVSKFPTSYSDKIWIIYIIAGILIPLVITELYNLIKKKGLNNE